MCDMNESSRMCVTCMSHLYVLLCFIKPILGNRYDPRVSSSASPDAAIDSLCSCVPRVWSHEQQLSIIAQLYDAFRAQDLLESEPRSAHPRLRILLLLTPRPVPP